MPPPVDPVAVAKLDELLLVAAGAPGATTDANGDVPREPDGQVLVEVDGSSAADAVVAVGGTVLVARNGRASATVPADRLLELAGDSGIDAVAAPLRPVADSAINQARAASGANVWASTGWSGAGVKVAVVDIGFSRWQEEIAAGNLPANTVLDATECGNTPGASEHGTAVAEVITQLAPGAQLYLYCIRTGIGFNDAVDKIILAGVTVANSSLGFPGDARGDGTGPSDSAATGVRTAREAGVLWIQSAGNSAQQHWSGQVPTGTGASRIDTVTSSGGQAVLQWDQWVGTPADIRLCMRKSGSTNWQCNSSAPADEPVQRVTLGSGTFEIGIRNDGGVSAGRYDITYFGSVESASATADPAAAAAGSVTSPASSPYALAVGAVCLKSYAGCGAPGSVGSLEAFSSRGPTIDSRVKPELSGYDGLASNLSSLSVFYGTSAAAPSVTGAAALILQAHPDWTAAQVQDYLIAQANGGAPNTPAINSVGAGSLRLGPPPLPATDLADPAVLGVGESLLRGQSLRTPDGRLRLTLQTDGNIGLFSADRLLWQLGRATAGNSLIIDSTGRLALTAGPQVIWSVGGPAPGDRLVLEPDGSAVLRADASAIWSTDSPDYRIDPGWALAAGQSITSPNRRFRVEVGVDGTLSVKGPGRVVYVTPAAGAESTVVISGLGVLVLASPTLLAWGYFGSTPGAYAAIQDDGNFAVYAPNGRTLWWTGFGPTLRPSEYMTAWERLIASDGPYQLILQGDGNVGFFGPGGLIWMTGTQSSGARLVYESSGNLSVYSQGGARLWASNTTGVPAGSVTVEGGVLWIRDSSGRPLWAAWQA